MLQPKRTKFRRVQKGRNRGLAHRGSSISFGSFGLKTLEPGWITSRQIEASRIAVTRYMKREGKVWIRIFPDKPVTAKPAEVRMGKGKGAPSHWVAVVKPGRIMFEADGVPYEIAKEAMLERMQKQNEMKISPNHYPEYLRPKLEKAYKAWKDIIGVDIPLSFQGVSMSDIIEAGINAVKDEQIIKKEVGPTQLDLFNK